MINCQLIPPSRSRSRVGRKSNPYRPTRRRNATLAMFASILTPFNAQRSKKTVNARKTSQRRTFDSQNSCPNAGIDPITRVLEWIDDHRSSIESKLLQSWTDENKNDTASSTYYLYDEFKDSLEFMAREGVGGMTFYMGVENCDGNGWQVGVANVAAFLAQSMVEAIEEDSCDEINWEFVTSGYPLSNACGQRGESYQDYNCPVGEEDMSCPVNIEMNVTAKTKSRYPDTPPPMQCFPQTKDKTYTGYYDPKTNEIRYNVVNPSVSGRTDVEGCCWWGRGALQTKGVCNLGKLNHHLGKRAAGLPGQGRYPDIDFCRQPEEICSGDRSPEIRWIVALFEWVERVQSYNKASWNYKEQLHELFKGDLLGDLKFVKNHFIDSVGGIVNQGCHAPPCETKRVRFARERKKNFRVALEALELPIKSEPFRRMEEILMLGKGRLEENVFLSQTPDGQVYQSYRYKHPDFLESLRLMGDQGFDGQFFYLGETIEDMGAATINVALFLAHCIVASIRDDACDEHNTQTVNERYPVSNACGQYGHSYGDMGCDAEEANMECSLDPNQMSRAVTHTLSERAPRPFKCAPKSEFPLTGYWDDRRIEENHDTAFANEKGRVDIEACCWWGRGVFRHVNRGRCLFGKMNYYIGKRAADEGRPSLYPDVDFCESPEAICASKFSNELRWASGLFYWVNEVQSYNKDGWNYIQELKKFSKSSFFSSESNAGSSFVESVDCILRTESLDCDATGNITEVFNFIMSEISDLKAPTSSPTISTNPTAGPSSIPSSEPTEYPSAAPTSSQFPSASPNIIFPPISQVISEVQKDILDNRNAIEGNVLFALTSGDNSPSQLYSFDAFVESLQVMASGKVEGKYFYLGHDLTPHNRRRGLVNIAAFLAHSVTVAVHSNACDELNYDEIGGKYPLSNACGQEGESYQDLRCPAGESFMECAPNRQMQLTAVDTSEQSNSPPPFYCGPKNVYPFGGYFDKDLDRLIFNQPFASKGGRTDLEACCWWGRGSAQMKGVCLYGKLNYYMGKAAFDDGRPSMFPTIDFCKNPQAICSGPDSYSLRWITGLFFWIEVVQSSSSYGDNLDKIVSDGMEDISFFIDSISDLIDGGKNKEKRYRNFLKDNFLKTLEAMQLR